MISVAITSVLIIKENILFLEEWIDYHLNLGFDIIYLYDNSKVQKRSLYDMKTRLIPQKVNKYGVKYDEIVQLSNEQIVEIVEKLKQKYVNRVYFIEWSPMEDGLVCYNQIEAHYDCLKLAKQDKIDWCASIDIDEFIVIHNGKKDNIKEYINELDKKITNIQLSQIRFDSRFNNLDKLVLDIHKAELIPIEATHSNKYIYKVEKTYKLHVHCCETTGLLFKPAIDELCFNHYKLNSQKYKMVDNINETILNKIKANSTNYIIKT